MFVVAQFLEPVGYVFYKFWKFQPWYLSASSAPMWFPSPSRDSRTQGHNIRSFDISFTCFRDFYSFVPSISSLCFLYIYFSKENYIQKSKGKIFQMLPDEIRKPFGRMAMNFSLITCQTVGWAWIPYFVKLLVQWGFKPYNTGSTTIITILQMRKMRLWYE